MSHYYTLSPWTSPLWCLSNGHIHSIQGLCYTYTAIAETDLLQDMQMYENVLVYRTATW